MYAGACGHSVIDEDCDKVFEPIPPHSKNPNNSQTYFTVCMAWSSSYERLLSDNWETYNGTKGDDQRDLLQALAGKVKAKAAKHRRAAPDGDLVSVSHIISIEAHMLMTSQKIKVWYNNNRGRLERGWKGADGSGDEDPEGQQQEGDDEEGEGASSSKADAQQSKKLKKKTYSVRDVAKQLWKEKIKTKIQLQHGATPKDNGFIGNYNATLSDLLNKATEDEMKELEEAKEEWNNKNTPDELLRK